MKLAEQIPDGHYARLPDEERDLVQGKVIEKLLGADASIEKQLQWVDQKAKTTGQNISNVIDDSRNEYIRTLIMSHQYEEAADAVIDLLHLEKAA